MSIVVEDNHEPKESQGKKPGSGLSGWVMGYVTAWRQVRDSEYQGTWDRAYQTYRGTWVPNSQSKTRERSKLIPPGFAMAVDLTVAEIVEGIFSRYAFFDLSDEATPEEKQAADVARKNLLHDLYNDGIIDTITEAVLCGALYGNGILKIHTGVETIARPVRTPTLGKDGKIVTRSDGQPMMTVVKKTVEKAVVYPVSIEPGQFVMDPGTDDPEEMLGFAFEYPMPLHLIRQRQKDRQYLPGDVGAYHGPVESAVSNRTNPSLDTSRVDTAEITEWHGYVPRALLGMAIAKAKGDEVAFAAAADPLDDELVDAIVMIANGSTILKAQANPSLMEDRAVVTWQHGTIPGRFTGRSVWEMAKHVHLAQEAEMRARVDNLAWTSNPMLKADLTKLPPKTNFDAWPGKVWATRGNPDEAIKEMRFADINSSTFQHMADLTTMMQQATGTVDSLASARSNIRDETATGSALAASGFLKRAKRVMYNIEGALTRLVRKLLTRKMQYEPDRYPEFHEYVVEGTMGMMAREVEAQQLLQALQFVDKSSPAHLLVLRSWFAGSSSPDRSDVLGAIDKMMQPDPKQQQIQEMTQKLQIENAVLTNDLSRAQIQKLGADAGLSGAKTVLTSIQAKTERSSGLIDNARLLLDKQEVDNQAEQNAISREKNDIQRAQLAQKKSEGY